MHRNLLVCASLFVGIVPLEARAAPRFGIEGGGGLVWIEYGFEYDEEDFDFEPRFEFNVAATAHFEFSRIWGLTTGLRYSRLGDDIEGVLTTANEPYGDATQSTLTTRHEYLGIPLLGRASFGHDLRPFLIGGAEVAWLIQSTLEHKDVESDITGSFERYNVTAVIGAGIEIGVGEHALEIAARYGYGLVDIARHGEFPLGTAKEKTREIAITLGFR